MKKYLVLTSLFLISVLSTSASLNYNNVSNNIESENKTNQKNNFVSKNIIDTIKKDSSNVLTKIELEKKEVENKEVLAYETAHVSFYGGKFHGRKTASGQIYNKNKLTAAHKKLPFGTKVLFYNEKTNQTITVTINDRGPYIKGRTFDLSEEAFRLLMNGTKAGVANLKYKIINPSEQKDKEKELIIKSDSII